MIKRIGLIGYGKMGKMVEEAAAGKHIEVAVRFDEFNPFHESANVRQSLQSVPVLIDFSVPDIVLENIRLCAKWSVNLVIGTTGWQKEMQEARRLAETGGIGIVYAFNFSLGVNLFYRILRSAAETFREFEGYDPYVVEAHHQFKKDAPSGTAIVISEILESVLKKRVPVNSVRAGYIPGTHSVSFDSVADTIELKHTARNRQGFAEGALLAAQWIAGKSGFHAFSDILD